MGWLARRRQKQATEMLTLIETAIGNRGKIVLDQMFRDQGIDPNNLHRSLKGEKGDKGERGERGDQGERGEDGKDGYDYRQAVYAAETGMEAKNPATGKTVGPTLAEINAAKQSIMGAAPVPAAVAPDPAPVVKKKPMPKKDICGIADAFDRASTCTKDYGHIGDCSWYAEPEEPHYREDDDQPYDMHGNPNLAHPMHQKKPTAKRTPRKKVAS